MPSLAHREAIFPGMDVHKLHLEGDYLLVGRIRRANPILPHQEHLFMDTRPWQPSGPPANE